MCTQEVPFWAGCKKQLHFGFIIHHDSGVYLEISKGGGGFFLLLWLSGHTQPHPSSIVFLAKGGGVLPNFENNRRTPLDPLVHVEMQLMYKSSPSCCSKTITELAYILLYTRWTSANCTTATSIAWRTF